MKNRTDELREISGKIAYADPLTSFFYQLIRDELPAGTVEKIVQEVIEEPNDGCLFTNGWLAQYARNLAETLLNVRINGLKKELEQAFDVAVPQNVKVPGTGDGWLQPEDIAKLEKEVIAACEQNGITPEAVSNFDEAKDMIETQKVKGLVTEEEAATALRELAEVEAQGVPRTDSSFTLRDVAREAEQVEEQSVSPLVTEMTNVIDVVHALRDKVGEKIKWKGDKVEAHFYALNRPDI